jgi:hypothetical protein
MDGKTKFAEVADDEGCCLLGVFPVNVYQIVI